MLRLRISKKLLIIAFLILFFSCISFQWVCASEYPKPFPDEEINKYIGKVVDASVLNEIAMLIEKKYPDHLFAIIFKIIEADTRWITDRGGQPTYEIKAHKILIASIVDWGPKSPSDNTTPLWQYHYEVTLSGGYGAVHGNYYIQGVSVFESATYWNVVSSSSGGTYIGVGLWNWNENLGRYHRYYDTPAWDTSYTWFYPAYYGHSVHNPQGNPTVYYDWYYE
ncbi:MAG: hypothetical protein NDF54_01010 [archaeon GB-1867-035]|nr:hypothetical protein [Candidatus Culexmicrobium profundum]